jgi:excisionase family DNA binding protein
MRKANAEFMSVSQIASLLDVSAGTIHRAVQRGELRAVRVGRLLRVRRSWLATWLDSTDSGLAPTADPQQQELQPVA